jgi:hypothetical protein
LIQALPRSAWLRQGASAVRARAATTPGRLWVVSIVVVVQALLLWVLGSTALISTRSTIDTIGGRTVPSIFEAQMIHETLAEADRSAANAYLLGDLETSGPRQDYEQEMSDATRALEQTAEHSGASRCSRSTRGSSRPRARTTGRATPSASRTCAPPRR